MRAEDLELLDRLDHLDAAALRDLDNLTCILLRQSGANPMAARNGTELGRVARIFGWRPVDLKKFLMGVETSLASAIVSVEKILAMPEFCLMVWRFNRAITFTIRAEAREPLTLYLVSGLARIQAKRPGRSLDVRLAAGDVYQGADSAGVTCRFEAGAEVVFFDFPAFREAYRNLRRFCRLKSTKD